VELISLLLSCADYLKILEASTSQSRKSPVQACIGTALQRLGLTTLPSILRKSLLAINLLTTTANVDLVLGASFRREERWPRSVKKCKGRVILIV
jgi:hypothetical protein